MQLDMDPKHLEANFSAIINSIHSFKPKREGSFITRQKQCDFNQFKDDNLQFFLGVCY